MLHLTKTAVLPDTSEAFFICLKEEGGKFEAIRDLESYEGKSGNFYLFQKENYRRSPWYGGFSYVDLLVEGVTEKFIAVTMDGYERVMGDEFGKAVPGVFTDEPNIEVQGENNIRWTPDLFKIFQETWDYDLRLNLPSLFEEVGDWKKVRHNYYQTLLQLFIDRWSKPWNAYTQEKGLEWTGHYWSMAGPNHGGDNMAMYACFVFLLSCGLRQYIPSILQSILNFYRAIGRLTGSPALMCHSVTMGCITFVKPFTLKVGLTSLLSTFQQITGTSNL